MVVFCFRLQVYKTRRNGSILAWSNTFHKVSFDGVACNFSPSFSFHLSLYNHKWANLAMNKHFPYSNYWRTKTKCQRTKLSTDIDSVLLQPTINSKLLSHVPHRLPLHFSATWTFHIHSYISIVIVTPLISNKCSYICSLPFTSPFAHAARQLKASTQFKYQSNDRFEAQVAAQRRSWSTKWKN